MTSVHCFPSFSIAVNSLWWDSVENSFDNPNQTVHFKETTIIPPNRGCCFSHLVVSIEFFEDSSVLSLFYDAKCCAGLAIFWALAIHWKHVIMVVITPAFKTYQKNILVAYLAPWFKKLENIMIILYVLTWLCVITLMYCFWKKLGSI